MDDKFGDIIYIVLTLVVVLFSAFKKKKTPRGVPVPPEEYDPSGEVFPPLSDLFSDDRQEEDPLAEPPEVSREPSFKANEQEPAGRSSEGPFVKSDYVFSASSSADDIRRQRKVLKKKPDIAVIHADADTDLDKRLEGFDLQQAVIYSEILKRPDF